MKNKKVIIIGAGIAGPLLAIQLKLIGLEVAIFEARAENTNEGIFLGLTPNGLNILKQFIDIETLKKDFTLGSMFFFNNKGQEIASLSTDYQKEKFGAETMQLKRSNLYKQIQKAAREKGIEVHYNKKLVGVTETENNVKVTFDDGTEIVADFLFGCDGTFSAVRKIIFPNENNPRYTKVISTGGYTKLAKLNTASKGINMTFGERGFFAYAVSDQNEVWWFNNYHREAEPTKAELKLGVAEEIKNYLLELHKNDDPLFSEIIQSSKQIIAYPVYDIPKLNKWHTARICLLGDASHATSPHIGQGASLAMEDAVCLANCFIDNEDAEIAFEKFQSQRRERVEKIIKQARKVGNNKSKPNLITVWFRDKMLKYFIKGEIKKTDWIYGFSLSAKAKK
jgi:2-polyprenyl-6-methoxyphenol hydroxylase-like FAD-dependent oxidoreductase